MSRRVDDLSQDPFAEDNMPEQQSMQEDMMDVAMDKAKTAAGNYVREAPKNFAKSAMWSFLLSFTLYSRDNLKRDRMHNRLARGEKIGPYEFFVGSKFTIFGFIRLAIFIAFFAGIGIYIYMNGSLDALFQEQAFLDFIGASSP